MLIKTYETEGLYGFGAGAHVGCAAMKRKNTHMLSFFVVALCAAVLTVVVAVLPGGHATASPLFDQTAGVSQTLGIAAIAALGLSAFACVIMLLMPAIISRRLRHRTRR